ncbi:hypothetical protein FRX31_003548 [Thalictrum thalictroides]|uniref:Werner syndrome-like exonuclease n=1 Tax=Thalictrum thalictroides TaxID=46969 RepID=A0A7J6XDB8_THATH|nr:hypothetical protein FRX31_003548 [Thalictrum thalictroides]
MKQEKYQPREYGKPMRSIYVLVFSTWRIHIHTEFSSLTFFSKMNTVKIEGLSLDTLSRRITQKIGFHNRPITTYISTMTGEGILEFISDIRSNNKDTHLLVGLHVDWPRNKERRGIQIAGILSLCVEETCLIIPIDDDKKPFHSLFLDFVDNPGIYFVGVDIHNCLSKINLECRNVIDIGTLCEYEYHRRPLFGALNVLDLARKNFRERFARPCLENVCIWNAGFLTDDQIRFVTRCAYAAFVLGKDKISFGY